MMKLILLTILLCCSGLGFALLVGENQKRCPHGWLHWRDTCFMFSVEKENWANAELRCRALGGYLAEVKDAETNTFLKNFLKAMWYDDHHHYYLIGLTDAAQANTWEWSHSKTLPVFNDWGHGQPQNNNEHCAIFHGDNSFTWHDESCDNAYNFICQENSF